MYLRRPHLFAALLLVIGCHQNIDVDETSSATDENQYFPDASMTEQLPTTTATDGEPPLDPSEFCELHPDAGFPGEVYACEGSFGMFMEFDYYGSPDIPLHTMLVCFDFSDVYEKEPGYVYTCMAQLDDIPFGPTSAHGDAQDVEACCMSKSPDEAVDPFCRIDAAHDMCVTASNQLNELREKLSKLPGMKDLKNQLLNLNIFLASSDTQTSCAQTFAKGLIDGGDILQSQDSIGWSVESPYALDPDKGWPWFRDIRAAIPHFVLKGASATGVACQDAGLGVLQGGALKGARVLVTNGETSGEARIDGGRVDVREAECAVDACAFELASLQLSVAPFELDGMRLTDVSATLVEPARGKRHGDLVRISGNKVELDVRGRVDGDEQTHRVRAQGDVLARRTTDGHFAIETLRVGDGPVALELSTDPVRTVPSVTAR